MMFIKEKFPKLLFIILNLICLNLTQKLNGDNKKKLILDNKSTNLFSNLTSTINTTFKNDLLKNSKKILITKSPPIKNVTISSSSTNFIKKNSNYTLSKSKFREATTSKINNFDTTQAINFNKTKQNSLDTSQKINLDKIQINNSHITQKINFDTIKSEITTPNLIKSETNSIKLEVTTAVSLSFLNINESEIKPNLKTNIINSTKLEITTLNYSLINESGSEITINYSLPGVNEFKNTEAFSIETDTNPKMTKLEETIQSSIKSEPIPINSSIINSPESTLNSFIELSTTKLSTNALSSIEMRKNFQNTKLNKTFHELSDNLENLDKMENEIRFDYGSEYYPDEVS